MFLYPHCYIYPLLSSDSHSTDHVEGKHCMSTDNMHVTVCLTLHMLYTITLTKATGKCAHGVFKTLAKHSLTCIRAPQLFL